jgi:hypothetical protein
MNLTLETHREQLIEETAFQSERIEKRFPRSTDVYIIPRKHHRAVSLRQRLVRRTYLAII